MELIAIELSPDEIEVRQDVSKPQGVGVLFHDTPAIFRPRRFSDPVSDLNANVHDKARLLASAIEMVDRMEIEIIAVEADRTRNSVIQVAYSRACDQLNGVEVARSGNGFSHWCANRNGVEIRWCIPVDAA